MCFMSCSEKSICLANIEFEMVITFNLLCMYGCVFFFCLVLYVVLFVSLLWSVLFVVYAMLYSNFINPLAIFVCGFSVIG